VSMPPETLIWIITGRCNLQCKHCYATAYREEIEIPQNRKLELIKEAADIGVEYIQYTGGEPLLAKNIFEILQYTKDCGIESSIFTNLTIINDKIASKLAKLEVGVYASIDGPSKEIYEKIRGLGSWSKALKGMKSLVLNGIFPHVNITVTELNWNHVKETINRALSLGASSISIIPAMPSSSALKNRVYVSPEHFLKALIQAKEASEELGIFVSVWCTPFLGAVIDAPNLIYGNCRNWDVMDMTPSGRVVLCDVLNIEVANVAEVGIEESYNMLVNHPLYIKVITPKLNPPCNTCSLRWKCKGGCYARAYLINKRLESPDPLCPIVESYFQRIKF